MDLAWMSSNTHLLTLAVLHDYSMKHHELRYWRLTFMICNFIMLFVANVYSGISTWYDDFAYPAQCDFDAVNRDPSQLGGVPARYAYVNAGFLVYGYVRGIVGLFPNIWKPAAAWYKGRFLRHLDRYFDSGIRYHSKLLHLDQTLSVKTTRLLLGLALTLYELAYTVVRMGFHIITSSAWSTLVIQTFWFAYGNWGVWSDRAYARTYMVGDEDKWGFGQLVPLLLIGLPVLSIMDNFYGQYDKLLERRPTDCRLDRGTTKRSEYSLNIFYAGARLGSRCDFSFIL